MEIEDGADIWRFRIRLTVDAEGEAESLSLWFEASRCLVGALVSVNVSNRRTMRQNRNKVEKNAISS